MFKMRSWRGKFIKALGWLLMKLHCLSEKEYFNVLLLVRAYEEGLRIVEVPIGEGASERGKM